MSATFRIKQMPHAKAVQFVADIVANGVESLRTELENRHWTPDEIHQLEEILVVAAKERLNLQLEPWELLYK